MGKNQAHKAMQRTRYGDTAGGDDDDGKPPPPGAPPVSADGMVDATFHTPAWHAARIQNMTAERLPYEEWQKQRKEAENKEALVAAEEEKRSKEYRALLDADRAKRLAKGVNHAELRDKMKKDKKKKHKSSDKEKSKKRKKDSKDSKEDGKESKKRKSRDSSSGSDNDSGGEEKKVVGDMGMRLSDWIRS